MPSSEAQRATWLRAQPGKDSSLTIVTARSSWRSLPAELGFAHTGCVNPFPPPNAPGVELRGVAKSYGQVRAVRGIDLAIAARRDRGPARPQRRRQVDHPRPRPRPRHARPGRRSACSGAPGRGGRYRLDRRDAADRRADQRAVGPRGAGDARLAVPRPDAGRRGHRRAPTSPTSPTGAPTSCRAARPSGCASPSRSSPTRGCSCSTSRRSPSTSRPAARSGRRCAASPPAGAPSCSPPTTSRRPTPSPTASC